MPVSNTGVVSSKEIAAHQKSLLSPEMLTLKETTPPRSLSKFRERPPTVTTQTVGMKPRRVAMIASYPPQKCGIATFTADLREALLRYQPEMTVDVIAVAERPGEIDYPNEVVCRVERNNWESYVECGDFLHRQGYDLVCLQHEFGLFGGAEGAYIIDMLRRLQIPVVTTLHTLLADPSPEYHTRTRELLQASDSAVVLTPCGLNLMRHVYRIPSLHNVRVIPHGIPDIPFTDPEDLKGEFGWEGRKVVMTFGLIGPSKGIEVMVDALPAVVGEHPDILYVIAGATHPCIVAQQGEKYRDELKAQIARLGVERNVTFVNRYIANDELCRFLQACDVYVTPYRNRDQISSGTLSYALAAGRALVSTPYWYAADLLAQGRGVLVDFESSEKLAEAVSSLLGDERKRKEIYRCAYEYSRSMTWERVAERYDDLFASLVCRPLSQEVRSMVTGNSIVNTPMVYRG